jgi:hypothetical protein
MRRIEPGLRLGTGVRLPWAGSILLVSLALASTPAQLSGQGAVHLTLRAQATLKSLGDPGAIVSAAEDSSGNVFILDDRSRVTIADRQVGLLGAFGLSARGSAARSEPKSIGVLRDGRVAVMDRAQKRITILRPEQGGQRLVPVDSIAFSLFPEGMCVLRSNTLLVLGVDSASHGMRLHVYSLSGRLLRSYAPADKTLDWRAQAQFAMGTLGCDEEHDQVLLANAWLPTVEAYRISTGRRIWVDTLRPYRPVDITILRKGLSIRWPTAGGHSVVAAALAMDSCRFFQTKFFGRQDGATVDTVASYLFRGAGRAAPAVQLDVPLLVPLGSGKVLSLPAAQPVLRLQDVRVDGCTVTSAPRPARRQSRT